ncbi:hypothetical protein Salat_2156900 [Sesamum alatum]|uniref:Uncharacterized protein n=1 Tax=Sesamum alatum TaxID=300844 RepID=A0AAE2CHA3_9LAMI|nr:hypothetical protein Salat_2156900 [Sesamum alatum]
MNSVIDVKSESVEEPDDPTGENARVVAVTVPADLVHHCQRLNDLLLLLNLSFWFQHSCCWLWLASHNRGAITLDLIVPLVMALHDSPLGRLSLFSRNLGCWLNRGSTCGDRLSALARVL